MLHLAGSTFIAPEMGCRALCWERRLQHGFGSRAHGAILGAPLPVGQSVLLIWPHLTGMIAATILLFALSYVSFQRREIRT